MSSLGVTSVHFISCILANLVLVPAPVEAMSFGINLNVLLLAPRLKTRIKKKSYFYMSFISFFMFLFFIFYLPLKM